MLNDDRIFVQVQMAREIHDQLLREGGSKPIHPMRLIPIEGGFDLAFTSVGGVLTKNSPRVDVAGDEDQETPTDA